MSILKLVARNLLRRKGRFVFTLLGITIGMASFVALLSIGGNMQNEVTRQAYALGGNFVIVPDDLCVYNQIGIITGEAISESLDFGAFERIAAIEGLTVIPHLTQRTAIQNATVTVTGMLPAETKAFRGWEMYAGEYFASQDQQAVVIGQGTRNRFDLEVGDELTIRGEAFPIIGILAATNSNDDVTLHIPLAIAQRVFEREGRISFMSAIVDNMERVDEYATAIMNVANVNVATNEQLLNSVLMILGSVNVTLQAVAGVALIAAAFGIINTMMTAVFERRREIGILQAIGAKGRAIFKIFVLESGIYGLLGGIIGVGAGFLVSMFVAPIVAQNNEAMLMGVTMGSSIDVQLVITTILFSVVISIVAGLYPAWKAAKLTPVEAISYE
ncbi:MAG: ABC transporter permease [Oscillospiraceae bacterium]|nr:ABC transporter permease [Oscillospiraceae bacterium]